LRTILITGFGRFPGAPVNPAGLVAARLVRRRRPALAATRRVAHVFATRYDAVDRELPALLTQEKPDIVVMFGVATRARAVRVEQRARNRIARFPDAGGHRPAAPTIAPQQDALRNPLPIARLVKAARMAGVAAAPSRNAGTYLCNFLYWRALEAASGTDGPTMVIFIHLPPVGLRKLPKKPFKSGLRRSSKKLPRKPSGRGRTHKRRAPRLNDLVRAGEAIVLAMVSLAAGRAPTKRAKLPT
jgi:pyroglutamyl-peptidase